MNIDKELIYRKALEKWLEENPKKNVNDVLRRTIVKIISEREEIEVKLGNRISIMRQALKENSAHILTEDQIEYWVNQKGLSINARKDKFDNLETNYRKALEKWLEENPDKNVNDISQGTIVKIINDREEIEVTLGNRINSMRQALKGNPTCVLNDDQIEYWVCQKGLSINARKDKMDRLETNCRKALENWLEENPQKNVNDVSQKTIVKIIIDNQEIEVMLGRHINNLRQTLKGNPVYVLTKDQINYWVNQKGLRVKIRLGRKDNLEDNYRKSLENWLEENPDKTINDVTSRTIAKVISEGEKIEVKLGIRIKNMRRALKGNLVGTLTEDQINYWFHQKGLKVSLNQDINDYLKLHKKNPIRPSKSNNCPKGLCNTRKAKQKSEYNIDNVLAEFHINIDLLNKYLNRTRKEKDRSKLPILMDGKETLRSYCIRNGYNYNVIKNAIKLKEFCIYDSLEQLINRVLTDYQLRELKEPSTWICEKYGTNIKEVFQYLKLDGQAILKDMANNIISLEEGIRHNIFETTVKEKEHKYLEELYNYLIEEMNKSKQETIIEDLASNFKSIVKKYELEKVEYTLLSKALKKYVEISNQYFVVENETIIVDKSLLYQRRQLLIEYIINWNNYSNQKKDKLIEENNVTIKELTLIEQTRRKIDVSNNQKKYQSYKK